MQQLTLRRRFNLSPRVSFAPALTLSELGGRDAQAGILDQAERSLEEHVNRPSVAFGFS
jgi:hypothetical protein